MATKKKMLQAAAGNAGGGGGVLNVEDVFSTYLYSGNNSTQTITNGIDLAGEGGLVWVKSRTTAFDHMLADTETGAGKYLRSNTTTRAIGPNATALTSFNSNGFSIGSLNDYNYSGDDIASWTFRKAPKFFTCVQYTGNGVAGRTISHDLGTTVGSIFIKRTDASGADWIVYHRSEPGKWGKLNDTGAFQSSYAPYYFGNNSIVIPPTSTEFTVGNAGGPINASGGTYIAYLFAHNDGDGEFGPTGDQDIIKCGSYTGNLNADGPEIDLGFEPQFVLVKLATGNGGNWVMADTMRGFVNNPSINQIYANTSEAEQAVPVAQANPTATGFKVTATGGNWNANGLTYIYIAIRRGTKVPESASEVFAMDMNGTTTNHYTSGFPVDLGVYKSKLNSYDWSFNDRLRGAFSLKTNTTSAENGNTLAVFDNNTGWADSAALTSEYPSWMWKRAPGFFDAVAFSGDGTTDGSHQISHNLGVAPEMIIYKDRNLGAAWLVWHTGLGQDGSSRYYSAILNSSGAKGLYSVASNGNLVNPQGTDTYFPVGGSNTNPSGYNYIAYLFASLPGISRVGSFSHTSGSNTDVDCGFTSGARFVLLKRTDNAGHWLQFDTERGLVAGNDAWLNLNLAEAENLSYDFIDPLSSGFTVDGSGILSTGSYIFYAIA